MAPGSSLPAFSPDVVCTPRSPARPRKPRPYHPANSNYPEVTHAEPKRTAQYQTLSQSSDFSSKARIAFSCHGDSCPNMMYVGEPPPIYPWCSRKFGLRRSIFSPELLCDLSNLLRSGIEPFDYLNIIGMQPRRPSWR